PSMHGIGYREWRQYMNGERSKKETVAAIQQATRNFAKRQMTWFRGMERRHPIHWVTTPSTAERIIKDFLT
ncbi:MAG: tRNA dimethylallyltransferase, partial [Patescibacteria group bacterium]